MPGLGSSLQSPVFRAHPMTDTSLILYTTTLCGDCWRVKTVLRTMGVAYREVDILKDTDGGEEMVRRSGQRHVPTLVFPDGTVLANPENLLLLEHLARLLESQS